LSERSDVLHKSQQKVCTLSITDQSCPASWGCWADAAAGTDHLILLQCAPSRC